MEGMKKTILFAAVSGAFVCAALRLFALSVDLPQPGIFFPKGYDTNRADRILSVLRSNQFKYLGGLTSYWEPEWSTTLVYEGNAGDLNRFLLALNGVQGVTVRLTFSRDLARETGSALRAGSWWVIYSHTAPDAFTVRINLAAESLGRDKFALTLPKAKP